MINPLSAKRFLPCCLLSYLPVLLVTACVLSDLKLRCRFRHFERVVAWFFFSLWMAETALGGGMLVVYSQVCQKSGGHTHSLPYVQFFSPRMHTLTKFSFTPPRMHRPPCSLHRQSGHHPPPVQGALSYGRSDWYDSMNMDPKLCSRLSKRDVGRHDQRKAQMALCLLIPLTWATSMEPPLTHLFSPHSIASSDPITIALHSTLLHLLTFPPLPSPSKIASTPVPQNLR